ncbi:MAG: hypothetical protein QM742_10070 [Aquabacterium sp.]
MPAGPVVPSVAAANALAALLRNAFAGQLQAAKRGAPAGKARKVAGGPHDPSAAGSQAALGELIARRAGELNPDARDYRSRLLRLVIEATLLHELGGNLMNAPKFQSMVDQILHDLEHAPQMKRDVDTVLQRLAKGQWPAP